MLIVGRRTDLEAVYDKLKEGANLDDLFRDRDTFALAVRYHRGIERAQQALQRPEPDQDPLTTTILFGPPGTGKTSAVGIVDADRYRVPVPTQGARVWFDGYRGQRTMLIDEYRGWIGWDLLKTLTDPWTPAESLDTKGSNWPNYVRAVYICSNVHPLRWHPRQTVASYRQLVRRVTSCWWCGPMVWRRVDLSQMLDEIAEIHGENALIL
jgi:hypothetical protein